MLGIICIHLERLQSLEVAHKKLIQMQPTGAFPLPPFYLTLPGPYSDITQPWVLNTTTSGPNVCPITSDDVAKAMGCPKPISHSAFFDSAAASAALNRDRMREPMSNAPRRAAIL